jgi:hypothetical protein
VVLKLPQYIAAPRYKKNVQSGTIREGVIDHNPKAFSAAHAATVL